MSGSASPPVSVSASPVVSGRWYDGQTAKPHAVVIALSGETVLIRDAAGEVAATWPSRNVRLLDRDTTTLRLGLADGSLPRLLLAADFWPIIRDFCPSLEKSRVARNWASLRRLALWGVGAVLGLLVTFLVLIPWAAEVVAANMSVETEQRIGNQAFEAMRQWASINDRKSNRPALCEGAAGLAALKLIEKRLTAQNQPRLPLQISVINIPLVNAFALPGGRMVLTRGLLGFVDNEAELAGVIAHEIGHIDARHNTAGFVKHSASGFLVGLFFGDAVAGLTSFGLIEALVASAYTRDMEAEADHAAIVRLRRAEVDPARTAGFFARLTERQAEGPALLRSHPVSIERAALFRAAAMPGQPLLTRSQWLDIRLMCS